MLPVIPKDFALWTPFSGLALLRPSQASPSDGSFLHRSTAREVLRRCAAQRDQLSTELISQSFALTVEVGPPAPGIDERDDDALRHHWYWQDFVLKCPD